MWRRRYHYIVAVWFILLALQNAVGELYLHDAIHETSNIGHTVYHHHDGDGHQHIFTHCDCLHDFLLPSGETPFVLLPQPTVIRIPVIRKTAVYHMQVGSPSFFTLRGPPSQSA